MNELKRFPLNTWTIELEPQTAEHTEWKGTEKTPAVRLRGCLPHGDGGESVPVDLFVSNPSPALVEQLETCRIVTVTGELYAEARIVKERDLLPWKTRRARLRPYITAEAVDVSTA